MLLVGMEMAREAGAVVQWAQSIAASSPTPPAWLSHLPLVGTRLAGWWRSSMAGSLNTADLSARLNLPAGCGGARPLGGGGGWAVSTLSLSSVSLFFLYSLAGTVSH